MNGFLKLSGCTLHALNMPMAFACFVWSVLKSWSYGR
jgi:hypothetical protein